MYGPVEDWNRSASSIEDAPNLFDMNGILNLTTQKLNDTCVTLYQILDTILNIASIGLAIDTPEVTRVMIGKDSFVYIILLDGMTLGAYADRGVGVWTNPESDPLIAFPDYMRRFRS